jgi:nitrite reductase (NADH) small subunit
VVCPWHGFEYNIKTGVHPGQPAARLIAIAVEETADGVYLTL